MKVQVDGKDVCELNETQKKVICNDIPDEIFQEDMNRRVNWVCTHKYEQCFKRLKQEWEPKLKDAGVQSIPLNEDAFAELVFQQPSYKNRSQREAEAKALDKKDKDGD